MGKDVLRKLKQYIKEDRPSRFRSYARKRRVDVADVVLSKERTLLHYCCKQGNVHIFRYLLDKGVDYSARDQHGNTALHVALRNALSASPGTETGNVYTEMVLPLLQESPELLEVKNNNGVSCRELLDQLVSKRQRSNQGQRDYSPEHAAESSWEAKLAEEFAHEYTEEYGRYQTHEDFGQESSSETYDEWADRIRQEYHKSRRFHAMPQKAGHEKVKDNTNNDSVPNLEKEREEMKKKYEANQRVAKENFQRHKKKIYEEKCQRLFTEETTEHLRYQDIPWPCKKDTTELSQMLFCDITDKAAYKKYLREQQVHWHPDKFHQRLGARLMEEDREQIENKVKQISQELNILSSVLS